MIEESGFYRLDQDGVFMRARWVRAPDYAINWADRDSYSYPTTGGWYKFDTKVEATTFFNIPGDTYCQGLDELSDV